MIAPVQTINVRDFKEMPLSVAYAFSDWLAANDIFLGDVYEVQLFLTTFLKRPYAVVRTFQRDSNGDLKTNLRGDLKRRDIRISSWPELS